ncbi:MAG: hypothetical protein ABFD69_05410 [Candidatus Sumerlaeia bacterium]
MSAEEPTKKLNWRVWAWAVTVILISPLIAFIGLEKSVNNIKIDERKIVPPPELARILSRAKDSATTGPLTAADQAAAEICREFASKTDAATFRRVFADKLVKDPKPFAAEREFLLPWTGGPLGEAQTKWVHAHADSIELALRYANAPGRHATDDPAMIDARRLMMQMLIADGWVKLHENRTDGIDSYLAIYGLARKAANPGDIAHDPFAYAANRMIQAWIEDDSLPKPNAPDVLSRLGGIYAEFHAREKHREQARALIELEYARLRKERIDFVNTTPWNSRTFGYDLHHRTDYYWPQIGKTDISLLPRVDRMLATTFSSMNHKRHSDEFVRVLDTYWSKALEWPDWPWPEISKRIFANDFVIGHCYGQLENRLILLLANETMINLNRAALARLAGMPTPGKGLTGVAGHVKDPGSPWRDPFTEKPLMIDEGTTRTLIYSLGPRLVDRHGRVDYWTTKTINADGNLGIKVPAKH